MRMSSLAAAFAALGLGFCAFGPIALAASATKAPAKLANTVIVRFEDPTSDHHLTGMAMVADHQTVREGRVTFQAANRSRELLHEMVIVKLETAADALPYDEAASKFVEDLVQHLGEIADLKPGKKGDITLPLAAGDYALVCNQPGHYKAGMWTKLTVLAKGTKAAATSQALPSNN